MEFSEDPADHRSTDLKTYRMVNMLWEVVWRGGFSIYDVVFKSRREGTGVGLGSQGKQVEHTRADGTEGGDG